MAALVPSKLTYKRLSHSDMSEKNRKHLKGNRYFVPIFNFFSGLGSINFFDCISNPVLRQVNIEMKEIPF